MSNLTKQFESSLEKAEVNPVDLAPQYWTPEKLGESKRMYFVDFGVSKVKDFNSDTLIDLPVVIFAEPTSSGVVAVANGAARLYSIFDNLAQQGKLNQGDAFEIAYTGKVKNKNNGFSSDTFSVKQLITNVTK